MRVIYTMNCCVLLCNNALKYIICKLCVMLYCKENLAWCQSLNILCSIEFKISSIPSSPNMKNDHFFMLHIYIEEHPKARIQESLYLSFTLTMNNCSTFSCFNAPFICFFPLSWWESPFLCQQSLARYPTFHKLLRILILLKLLPLSLLFL